MICATQLTRQKFTKSLAGCLKQNLRTALKRLFSGISITKIGGMRSSMASIKIIMRRCMGIDKEMD